MAKNLQSGLNKGAACLSRFERHTRCVNEGEARLGGSWRLLSHSRRVLDRSLRFPSRSEKRSLRQMTDSKRSIRERVPPNDAPAMF